MMINTRNTKQTTIIQQGFTLLEMVLVLFLISLMASATLFLTENVEDQAKYDETKRRMEIIREGIVGDPTRTLNGETELRGFAMDIGRLPECMRELLSPEYCNGADIPLWKSDASTEISYGWNGPYLQTLPESDGVTHFRDGYLNQASNNTADNLNSGWLNFNSMAGLGPLTIQSDNSDRTTTSDDITVSKLVSHNDYLVTLASHWQEIDVELELPFDDDFTINANDLRLRLNFPVDGELPSLSADDDERDLTAGLSERFPSIGLDFEASNNFTATLPSTGSIIISPPATLSGAKTALTILADTEFTYRDTATGDSITFTLDSSCPAPCITGFSDVVEPSGTVSTLSFSTTLPTDVINPVFPSTYLVTNLIVLTKTKSLFNPTILLPSGSTISGTTITLPNGASITIPSDNINIDNRIATFAEDDDGNTLYDADADVTVSESFTIEGNLITTDVSSDTFYVPSGTQDSGNTLTIPTRLPITFGEMSVTVICDSNDAVFNAFDGTGACGYDSDLQTSAYTMKYVPRAAMPSRPAPLIWTIQ